MKELSELTLEIQKIFQTRDKKQINQLFDQYQDADIASALNELEDEQEKIAFFKLVSNENQIKLFAYFNLETQELLVQNLNNNDLKLLVNNIYSDDLVDLIDDLPKNDVKKVLDLTSAEKRMELNDILQHGEQTAGGIMSVNFLKLPQDLTIEQAIKEVQQVHDKLENVDDLFVVDEYETLVGEVQLKDLLVHNPQTKLAEIMDPAVVSTMIDKDQEEVARLFKRYDITNLAVINQENKLAGIITIDDVIDVLERETTEDIQKFAGVTPLNDDDPFKQRIDKMFLSRMVWLGVGILLATIAQILLVVFANAYDLNKVNGLGDVNSKAYGAVYLYLPLVFVVACLCGITINQSTSNVVRALSIKDDKKKFRKLVGKEIITSSLIALVVVVVNLVRLVIFYAVQFNDVKDKGLWNAILVSSLTLIIGILLSGLLGSFLPWAAKRTKHDPALISSPLITGLMDVLIISIFFGLGLAFY